MLGSEGVSFKLDRIRDPIHGFIYLTKEEMAIVDSPLYQRLRRINQDGMTHLVYPGAEHTRFQHSLGVMHLASNIFDRIVQKNALESTWGEEEVRRCRHLLRLYALLHDVGHAPFSHASEEGMEQEESLFPQGASHETYTVKMIASDEIGGLIRDKSASFCGVTPDDLLELIEGTSLDRRLYFLRQLMNSEVDADKMDYLLRDSHYCGVAYGLFDLRTA